MRRTLFILVVLFLLFANAGCLPKPVSRAWTMADLRWLGDPQAPSPATELVAVYTRTLALTVEIRLDLLDITPKDHYKMRLTFHDDRDFATQPLVVELDSSGAASYRGGESGKLRIWPRVIQDYSLDTITVSLNRYLVGSRYRVDVSTYTTEPLREAAAVKGIRSDGQAPSTNAPAVLEFWNTFPAETPAQALRRWDGAHTGPLGGRHGLRYVLDAAWRYHIPLVLVDLKTPASLAALNYLQGMGKVLKMMPGGWLTLPEVEYAAPEEKSLALSREAGEAFGLPSSKFAYPADGKLQWGFAAQFVKLEDATRVATIGGMRLIPLPAADTVQATEEGPAMEVRQALLGAALSPDPADLVTLGGSLPDSTWGDPAMAMPTLAWLAGHPWVRLLNGSDLLAFPAQKSDTLPESPQGGPSPWAAKLEAAPQNAITRTAWQAFLMLNAPADDPKLQTLRQNYLGNIDELLEAARWAEKPSAQADCSRDLNGDGKLECLLTDRHTFAILDPAGARLSLLFVLERGEARQVVGESSQFAVGLSDPSEWKLEKGEAADPSVIPGGFADSPDAWADYAAQVITTDEGGMDAIRFSSDNGKRVKTYQLTQTGMRVEYKVPGEETTRLPLAVDAQAFYEGPAEYRAEFGLHTWTWGRAGGLKVEVQSEAKLRAQGFNSSYPFLLMPEDPNLDFPVGHYLPFPLSLVTITGKGSFSVEIGVR